MPPIKIRLGNVRGRDGTRWFPITENISEPPVGTRLHDWLFNVSYFNLSVMGELMAPADIWEVISLDPFEIERKGNIGSAGGGGVAFRVGFIIQTISYEHPSEHYGGTWTRFAEGRSLIGFDVHDPDFNQILNIGGEKVHFLTEQELAIHNHNQTGHSHTITHHHGLAHTHTLNSHAHTMAHTHTLNSHTHILGLGWQQNTGGTNAWGLVNRPGSAEQTSGGPSNNNTAASSAANTGTSNVNTSAASVANTGGSSAANTGNETPFIHTTGHGLAHNNLSPYIICYMWVKTSELSDGAIEEIIAGTFQIQSFITIDENGVITGFHSGDINSDFSNTFYKDQKKVIVPRDAKIKTLDNLSFYNDSWERKSQIELIKEKLLPVPERYILDLEKECVRPMTVVELIENGFEKMPLGFKIKDGNLIPLTPVERIKAGIDILPEGYIIKNEIIRPMTPVERIKKGLDVLPEDFIIEGTKLRELTQVEKIEKGLEKLPIGFIIENNELRELTQVERINDGLEELPEGFIIDGDELREMTSIERMEKGIDKIPVGKKLVDGELIDITLLEQLEIGQISQEEYNREIEIQNERTFSDMLNVYFYPEVLARAELDESYAKERREKLQAILDIKNLNGWPLEVEWPEGL